MTKDMKAVRVDIPDEQHKILKAHISLKGLTIADWLRQIIEKELEETNAHTDQR